MRMPGGAGPRFEPHPGPPYSCRGGGLDDGILPHRAGKPFGRHAAGRHRAQGLDLHESLVLGEGFSYGRLAPFGRTTKPTVDRTRSLIRPMIAPLRRITPSANPPYSPTGVHAGFAIPYSHEHSTSRLGWTRARACLED